MSKLRLGALEDDKPIKVTVELPATVYRNLLAYAEILGREHNQTTPEPAKLIPPMLARFMETDRGFAKLRRTAPRVPRPIPQ